MTPCCRAFWTSPISYCHLPVVFRCSERLWRNTAVRKVPRWWIGYALEDLEMAVEKPRISGSSPITGEFPSPWWFSGVFLLIRKIIKSTEIFESVKSLQEYLWNLHLLKTCTKSTLNLVPPCVWSIGIFLVEWLGNNLLGYSLKGSRIFSFSLTIQARPKEGIRDLESHSGDGVCNPQSYFRNGFGFLGIDSLGLEKLLSLMEFWISWTSFQGRFFTLLGLSLGATSLWLVVDGMFGT